MTDVHRLPTPVSENWDWQRLGSCRGANSAVFFHPDSERGSARQAREATAKRICDSCPVRAECLRHAIQVQEPYGIWGGMGENERRAVISATRRQLKSPVSVDA